MAISPVAIDHPINFRLAVAVLGQGPGPPVLLQPPLPSFVAIYNFLQR